ncbi:Calcium-independent receptor for alpha-latrotoxin [Carabus blaptoides fortunei]
MLLFGLLLALASIFQCDATNVIGCENTTLDLYCTNGKVIRVLSANYGRTSIFPCFIYFGANNCEAANSTQIVGHRCNNQQKCSIDVSNRPFGDPCALVPKYLNVSYTCVTIQDEDQVLVTCQNQTMNCSSPNATQTVSQLCNNLPSCTITANNKVFGGDPCFLGTRKYLQVDWTCETKSSTACQDSDLTINCPKGTSINVGTAVFGRIKEDICPGGIVPLPQDQNCTSPNATDISMARCNRLQSCTLNVNTFVFGDPCPGTRYSLNVSYTCPFTNNTGPVKGGTVCQNQTLYMSCPGKVINVINAFFGRLSDRICRPLLPLGRKCQASGATNRVRQLCGNKESCNVSASFLVFGYQCILNSNYLNVNFTCVDAPPPPPPPSNVINECEGSTAKIRCPAREVINIVYANYGRTSLLTCPSILGLTNKCISPNATQVVRNLCENLNSCAIGANNGVFGDPCNGNKKYLNITFTCQPLKASTVRACQNSTLTITCPIGTTIDVVSARFGRTSNKYCSTSHTPVRNCTTSNATNIVKEKCDNKQYCSIQANNSLFGNPCGANPNYLEVSYACFKGTPISWPSEESSPVELNQTVCENTTHSIYCPKGQINIVYASYGRTSANTCTNFPEHVSNCQSNNATEIVRKSCENLGICTITANSNIYGDPCIGSSKYLEVIYFCEETSTVQKSVCENQTLNLSCPSEKVIDIVRVKYGRFSNTICPIANYSSNKYCISYNASAIVVDLCDNKRNCSVVANNEVFGNVCPDISTILQVFYKCLYSKIPSTPTHGDTPVTTHNNTVTSCENSTVHLSCPNGYTIKIIAVVYGRLNNQVCPTLSSVNNCSAPNAKETTENLCNHHQKCTVGANNNMFATNILSDNCDGLSSCVTNISRESFEKPCFGTYKSLMVFFICAKRDTNQTISCFNETACENTEFNLSCGNGGDLNIKKANYGRSSSSVCPRIGQDQNTNCKLQNSTQIVSESCDGQSSCSMNATNGIFGDACPGTYKYLCVEYSCPERLEVVPSKGTACQDSTLTLTCPVGQHLYILLAIYGRLSTTICPTNSLNENTNCTSFNATSVLSSRCNNAETCRINANSSELGDPCPNTYEYLIVYYRCSATLQCGLNEKIGCANSCTNRMCGISSNVSLCLSKICAQGCVCDNGYVRDPNNGLCIEEMYCPLPGRPCQTHEVFTRCGAGCQASCVEPDSKCGGKCISGYVCKEGFIRDTSTGRCVRSEDCPCS